MDACVFSGCGKAISARGLCHGHYKQRQLGKRLRPLIPFLPRSATVADRFWAKVSKAGADDCWMWTGALSDNGYGVLGSATDGKRQFAHRLSYSLNHGAVPDGLSVLHRCDVRACVNPDHLFAGTQAENLADMDAKGRRVAYDRSGEKNPRAKLTLDMVATIRALRSHGKPIMDIARDFEISPSHASRICLGGAWS